MNLSLEMLLKILFKSSIFINYEGCALLFNEFKEKEYIKQ